ncbi:MAG: hypothetical protein P4L50_22590 [Anaerolineaceae bacterium]|nr:hypothetical protein [Anaerolineaceae bacterium]
MPGGIPIDRQWILILKDGAVVIDWGNNMVQDIVSGDFMKCNEREISHRISDQELQWLANSGRVERFDTRVVYFFSLPERPQRTID